MAEEEKGTSKINSFWDYALPNTGLSQALDMFSHKQQFVAWGMGTSEKLLEFVRVCAERNKTAVYLIPSMNVYPFFVTEAIKIGKEHFHLYEVEMGTKTVLNARAEKYVEYWKDSILIGEI